MNESQMDEHGSDTTGDATEPSRSGARSVSDLVLWGGIAVVGLGLIVVAFLLVRSVLGPDEPPRTAAEQLLERGMEAVRSDPASGTAHIDLGAAYFETGQYDKAEAEFEVAAGIKATEIPATYNLAHVYRLTDRTPQAIEGFTQVLEMKPSKDALIMGTMLRDARYWLGRLHNESGEYQKAYEAVEPILASVPLDAQAWKVAAAAYVGLGRTQEAKAAYEGILAVQPDDDEAREGLRALGAGKE